MAASGRSRKAEEQNAALLGTLIVNALNGDWDAIPQLVILFQKFRDIKSMLKPYLDALVAGEAKNELSPHKQAIAGWLFEQTEFGIPANDNSSKSFEFYHRAALQGDPHAQMLLGDRFRVADDFENAAKWYDQAVLQDLAAAKNALGEMCKSQKNDVLAVEWFSKAAAQNDYKALANLASAYRKGEGVSQDISQAAYYYYLAIFHPHNINRVENIELRLLADLYPTNPYVNFYHGLLIFSEDIGEVTIPFIDLSQTDPLLFRQLLMNQPPETRQKLQASGSIKPFFEWERGQRWELVQNQDALNRKIDKVGGELKEFNVSALIMGFYASDERLLAETKDIPDKLRIKHDKEKALREQSDYPLGKLLQDATDPRKEAEHPLISRLQRGLNIAEHQALETWLRTYERKMEAGTASSEWVVRGIIAFAQKHYKGHESGAWECFQEAARTKNPDPRAFYFLGVMCQNGQGLPSCDLESAKGYFEKAEALDYKPADSNVRKFYQPPR